MSRYSDKDNDIEWKEWRVYETGRGIEKKIYRISK